jgi:hypothetical protein
VLSLFASFAIPRKTMENQDKQQSVQPTEQTAPETPTNDEPPASVPGQ